MAVDHSPCVTLQGGAEGLGTFLNTAPPPCYLIYLLAAGFGFPCSEDALVRRPRLTATAHHSSLLFLAIDEKPRQFQVLGTRQRAKPVALQVAWVGANAANGMYGGTFLPVLGILYVGVVLSDLITFGIGILLRMGFLKTLKKSLLR